MASPVRQQQKDNLFDEADVKVEEPVKDPKSLEPSLETGNKLEENHKLSDKRRSLSESEIHKTTTESDRGSQKKTEHNPNKQPSIEEESSEHYYPTAVDTQSVEGVVMNVSFVFRVSRLFHLTVTGHV